MRTVLHTESSLGLGGQEIRTLTEARWTGERGWRVLLAGPEEGRLLPRARAAGIEARALAMRGPWDVPAVRRLVGLIRTDGVSVVHTHSSIDAWLGGMAARIAGVPVVRTRHVSIPIRRGLNPVYRWLADRVITSGEAIRSLVVAAGVPPARVVAIPAGVDLATYRRAGRGPALRREFGLAGPAIGSIAMFRGSKGHRHLLDAFARLRPRVPGLRLLLVGDGIRRTWVESLAVERGLRDEVIFTGFRSDVPALLEAMDCFVLASTRTEGVPQSLLQAFAAEVPVVASAIGGIPEVVTDGATGWLVPPGDDGALAAAISHVLADPAEAARRARAGRRLVEERFSHASVTARTLALYEELIGARGARAA
ncbi:MAG: glycosyltransferase [Candidatus Rokubacteria bacterium]|nr:glycosyltransferase [Candidatus Rokubacteria bacterium]